MFISQNQLEEELEGFLESGWRRAHSIGPPSFYRNSPHIEIMKRLPLATTILPAENVMADQ
jgi:hypothetical protein